MKGWRLFIVASVLALLSPLFSIDSLSASGTSKNEQVFPGWPSTLQGLDLKQVPLTEREKNFAKEFPGRIGLFSDGQQQYIIRWVIQPTRKLHPAADCFRGSGYHIKHLPLWQDSNNCHWSAFNAAKNGETLYVREHIYDSLGNNWADISAWYWAAAFGRTNGPWWVVTAVERVENSRAE